MKQPWSGVAGTFLTLVLASAVISTFGFLTFTTWIAWLSMCMIPAQILIGVSWAANPTFVEKFEQPLKGFVLVVLTVLIGAVVAVAGLCTVGGQIMPPAPMLSVYTILTVIVMFWMAIMFGGWPFSLISKNPVISGVLMLVACYLFSYLAFRIFFNFEFMRGAPSYVTTLDPRGLFNANNALVFVVTAISILFLLLHFDLWPLSLIPGGMRQPWLGLSWTVFSVLFGGFAMYVGIRVFRMESMSFMVKVPIPLIFGTIIVLNMLQNSLFKKLGQPWRGFCNSAAAAIVGALLAYMYGYLAFFLFGTVQVGGPGNDYERWLASALLGVTFPLLIFFAEYFRLWPLVFQTRIQSK